ncbi:hypothetical protein TKK_0002608 [Trichogramma kaykai]|uniref:Uncharacterized protein n=1 Tax=Trichogramma kaykai TaxID=54128 RepID=A0ABD2WZ51_9HYME
MTSSISTTGTKLSDNPLLPPLITNDIAVEIQYYKSLAIAVAERLKILEKAKETLEKNQGKVIKDIHDICSENETIKNSCLVNSTVDKSTIPTRGTENEMLINFPTKDEWKNSDQIDHPVNEKSTINYYNQKIVMYEQKRKQDKSNSNQEKDLTDNTFPGDSVCSDTITNSTDLNHYLNSSASTITNTTETTPENAKPKVPKTLDIISIPYDQQKILDNSKADGEVSKLIRQGSYVLETPSPILLAHMQNNEQPKNKEYEPTSSQTALKRKGWNINQTKIDWESQSVSEESKLSRMNSYSKSKKFVYSSSHRECKSVSNSKTGSPLDLDRSSKSVDCIQAMFAKECYASKTIKSKVTSSNSRLASPLNSKNRNNTPKKYNNATPILNMANKLSSSMESFNNVKRQTKPEKKINNGVIVKKNTQPETTTKNGISSQSMKPKPAAISEKIISVFKEIQDTHRKQMDELMSRQQKEQLLMQDNFKKQQILMLAQIRKAFPDISISSLSDIISHKSIEHPDSQCSNMSNKSIDSILQKNCDDRRQINGSNENQRKNSRIEKYPTDNTFSNRNSSETMIDYQSDSNTLNISQSNESTCQTTQTQTSNEYLLSTPCNQLMASSVQTLDDMPVGNFMHRNSNVSRQLFSHDGKSNSVAIFDISNYTELHVKAVTTINSYVRGFLVRRLMKTEKIIALKNTYREALHCMLRLHVDAPLNLPELNFHQRLQLQCDAASMKIVDLFSCPPAERMEIIAHDRELRKARSERPNSAHSYSFATQRTLARKKLKEMGISPNAMMTRSCPVRTKCLTWTCNSKEKKLTTSMINHGIKRSTSTGTVRRPWR